MNSCEGKAVRNGTKNLPELQWKWTCQNHIKCLQQTLNPLVEIRLVNM